MPEYFFTKEGSTYHFYGQDKDDLIYATEEVGIVFDSQAGMLMKHGPAERMRTYLQTMQARYRKSGYHDLAGELKVLTSTEWRVEDLNKVVSTTGFLKGYIEQMFNEVNDAG